MTRVLQLAATLALAVFLAACEDITIPDPPSGGTGGGEEKEERTSLVFTGQIVDAQGNNVELPEYHHAIIAWMDGRGTAKIGREPELSPDRKSYIVTFGPEELTKDHFYDPLNNGSGVAVARILSVTPKLGEGIVIDDRQLLPNMTTGMVDANVVFKLNSAFDSQNDQGWAANFENGYSLATTAAFNGWTPADSLSIIDTRLHLR